MEGKMKLTVAVLVIFIWLTRAADNRSVHFISENFFDYFMALDRMMIDPTTSSLILPYPRKCDCKIACFAATSRCSAWSITELADNSFECRLESAGPIEIPPVNDAHSTYFFQKASIDGVYRTGWDQILYVELNGRFNYTDGKNLCASIPGHRLMIIKTRQAFSFVKTFFAQGGGYVVVDLNKVNRTTFVWADGTNFRDTELAASDLTNNENLTQTIYIINQGVMNDCSPERCGPFRIVCQANSRGVNW